MLTVEYAWVSNNPMGININLGYYALAECILTKTTPSDALLKWCNVWHDHTKPRKKYVRLVTTRTGEKTRKILNLYRRNPNMISQKIADKVGCTPEMVCKVLRSIGVHRNRWDGYISKDPRYSKEKREAIK